MLLGRRDVAGRSQRHDESCREHAVHQLVSDGHARPIEASTPDLDSVIRVKFVFPDKPPGVRGAGVLTRRMDEVRLASTRSRTELTRTHPNDTLITQPAVTITVARPDEPISRTRFAWQFHPSASDCSG